MKNCIPSWKLKYCRALRNEEDEDEEDEETLKPSSVTDVSKLFMSSLKHSDILQQNYFCKRHPNLKRTRLSRSDNWTWRWKDWRNWKPWRLSSAKDVSTFFISSRNRKSFSNEISIWDIHTWKELASADQMSWIWRRNKRAAADLNKQG